MSPPTYYHLHATDYATAFPAAPDAVPVMLDTHTFIDDWVFNRLFSMIQSVQTYLIQNRATLEA